MFIYHKDLYIFIPDSLNTSQWSDVVYSSAAFRDNQGRHSGHPSSLLDVSLVSPGYSDDLETQTWLFVIKASESTIRPAHSKIVINKHCLING